MDDISFRKADFVQRTEHSDYTANYTTSQSAMKNLAKIPGLRFKLEAAGAQGGTLPFAIFMITWCNQDLALRCGTFAHPVFLHQSKEAFSYELSEAYKAISTLGAKKLGVLSYESRDMF